MAYDADNKTLHTFLLGGIGDGNLNGERKPFVWFYKYWNHIQLKVDGSPLKSHKRCV